MILVTGGAGFIGSVLVRELNKRGRKDIVIVDRMRDGAKWMNLRSLKFDSFYHVDDFFLDIPGNFWDKVDQIYHMGACSATTERDVDYLMKNNVEMSKKLFALASKRDISICYASSAATYGDGEQGYSDDESKIDELRPLNAYGYSKQHFDQWVLSKRKQPKVWYGVKFFNVYGPNEYHKGGMRSMVHKSFGQIQESGLVKLFKSHRDGFKDGEQLRDFVYVKDVVEAMIQMLELKNPKPGIYNLGTGKAGSFNDLVRATFKALDKKPNIEYVDMPEELRNQYQYYTQADMEKFHSLLPGFKFKTLEEGVKDYVQNHLMQKDPHV